MTSKPSAASPTFSPDSFKYNAFISYSHKEDAEFGRALHASLQSFARPFFQSRSMRVFIDDASIPMTSDLWGVLKSALTESSYLLLLASPGSAQSRWVIDEVDTFLTARGTKRLGIALTRGTTPWTDADHDPKSSSSAIADAVVERINSVAIEPLIIDLRPYRDSNGHLRRTREYDGAVASIVSAITGRDKDLIYGEHIARLRARLWVFGALVSLLIIALVTTAVLGVLADRRRVEALHNLVSSYLALGDNFVKENGNEKALHYYWRAYDLMSDQDGRAPQALFQIAWNAKFLPGPFKHTGMVFICAAGRNPGKFLTVSGDRSVRIWDSSLGSLIGQPMVHPNTIISIAFDRDRQLLLTGCADNAARVWDTATGTVLGAPIFHESAVSAVAFSPDAENIATVTDAGVIAIWDRKTSTRVGALMQDEAVPPSLGDLNRRLAYAQNGNTIISANALGTVTLWNLEKRTVEKVLAKATNLRKRIAVNSTGRMLAMNGHSEKEIHVVDLDTFETSTIQLPESATALSYSVSGNFIATGHFGGNVFVWDAKNGEQVCQLRGVFEEVISADFFPDLKMAVVGDRRGRVTIWDTVNAKATRSLSTVHDTPSIDLSSNLTGAALAFGPNADKLLMGSGKTDFEAGGARESGQAWLWDIEKNAPIGNALKHDMIVTSVAYSADGKLVATACRDKQARIWDAASGELIKTLSHGGIVKQVVFSRDGEKIATASEDKSARVWNIKDESDTGKVYQHGGPVNCVAVNPKGDRMVTGTSSNALWIWDLNNHVQIGEPIEFDDDVISVDYSLDTRFLLVCTKSFLQVRDSTTLKVVSESAAASQITIGVISPDGQTVAIGTSENKVLLLDSMSGHVRCQPLQHILPVRGVAFSRDSQRLATSDLTGGIHVWDIPPLATRDRTHLKLSVEFRCGLTIDENTKEMRKLNYSERLARYEEILRRYGTTGDLRAWKNVRQAELDWVKSMQH